jgi:hypothetical protein
MAIYKFSNVGGFGTYQRYNDFLAGNPAVILDAGSYFPLGEFTLASAQASVTFSNIPQTYSHLQIRAIARSNFAATSENIYMTFNNVTTGSLYAQHQLAGDGSAASASSVINQDRIFPSVLTGSTAGANTFGATVIDILDYRNTNKFKTTRAISGNDNNGNNFIVYRSGLFRSTNAITEIQLSAGVTYSFTANSSFALYGVLA